MEALEIEGQTDQAPLESFGRFTAQGELAEAQHLLDDADHQLDDAFDTNVRSNGQICMARDPCERGTMLSVRTHIGMSAP